MKRSTVSFKSSFKSDCLLVVYIWFQEYTKFLKELILICSLGIRHQYIFTKEAKSDENNFKSELSAKNSDEFSS